MWSIKQNRLWPFALKKIHYVKAGLFSSGQETILNLLETLLAWSYFTLQSISFKALSGEVLYKLIVMIFLSLPLHLARLWGCLQSLLFWDLSKIMPPSPMYIRSSKPERRGCLLTKKGINQYLEGI